MRPPAMPPASPPKVDDDDISVAVVAIILLAAVGAITAAILITLARVAAGNGHKKLSSVEPSEPKGTRVAFKFVV